MKTDSATQLLAALRLLLLALALAPTTHAANLDAWQWRRPSPQGNDLHAMTYASNRFVAVGDYGTILSSTNGTGWAVHSLETNVVFTGVAHGQGRFVAVGTDYPWYDPMTGLWRTRSFIWSSPDGTNWSEQPFAAGMNGRLARVAFGNGTFVAVGSSNTTAFVLTSPDGTAWTQQYLPITANPTDVAYGGGQFVVVSASSESLALLTSPDGVNWTPRDAGTNGQLGRVAFGEGRFVAVGRENYPSTNLFAVTSTDGVAWVRGTFPRFAYFGYLPDINTTVAGLAYGNGLWTLLVGDDSRADTVVFVSPDGANWVRAAEVFDSDDSNVDLRTLAFGDGLFAAAGSHGALARSVFPSEWTVLSGADGENFRGVTYANRNFIAVGNDGLIATSAEGVRWQERASPTALNLHHVATGHGLNVAVGGRGTVLTSPDGQTWTARASGTPTNLFDVVFGDGRFVAVGGVNRSTDDDEYYYSTIITSTNGFDWTTTQNSAVYRLHGVAHGAGLFVAVGQPGVVLTSSDGLDWSRRSVYETNFPGSVSYQYFKSVAFGNGTFVAVGESGLNGIATSADGVTWTNRAAGLSRFNNFGYPVQLDEVTFADGQFIAVGDMGTIITSIDGRVWTLRHSPTAENLRGVCATPGGAVIVGNNEVILQAGAPVGAEGFSVDSFAPIEIPDSGEASPYPSVIQVSDVVGEVTKVVVTLHGLSHTFGGDVNALLVGPAGQRVAFMVNAGGGKAVTNLTLAFDDAAVEFLPETNALVSGVFRPTSYSPGILFPAPAPPPPYATTLAAFQGTDANGPWSLYVFDDEEDDWGVIAEGWRLTLSGVTNLHAPACNPLENWTVGSVGNTNHLFDATFGNSRFAVVGGQLLRATSNDGFSWTNQTFPAPSQPGVGITHGNGEFIGLYGGPSGFAWFSTNGIDYVASGVPMFHPAAIAFGGGQSVVVATNGIAYTITNRIVTQRTTGVTNPLNGVTFGAGRFVAVGNNGVIRVSLNGGLNWIGGTSGTTARLTDVAFSDGLFVAVGAAGTVLTSFDGLAWTARASGSAADFTGVAGGAGWFAAIGNSTIPGDGLILSEGGASWRPHLLEPAVTWNDIVFGQGRFIAVGNNGTILRSGVLPTLLSQPESRVLCVGDALLLSADFASSCPFRIQWRRNGVDIPLANQSEMWIPEVSLADAGDYTVEVSSALRTVVSTAAVVRVNLCRALDHWGAVAPASLTNALNGVACADGRHVVVGTAGSILHSVDATNWVRAITPTNVTLTGVAAGAGRFVAVGFNGVILSSTNAVEWSQQVSGTNRGLRGSAYGAGQFVVVGDFGTVLTSADGSQWMMRNPGTTRTLLAITHADGQFVVVGSGGGILTSPDGVAWTLQPSGVNLTFHGVAHGAGRSVVVGNAGTILWSTNNTNWSAAPSPVTTLLNEVCFAHGRFVAVGVNGVVLSSWDGIDWAVHESGTVVELTSVAACDGSFLATGANGTILRTAYAAAPTLLGRMTFEGFLLAVTGEIGVPFRIQFGSAPAASWIDLFSFTNARPTTVHLDARAADIRQRYYRVISP